MTGDPYKTLFVARLVSSSICLSICSLEVILFYSLLQNYETTEHRIKREFESYGPIKRVSVLLCIDQEVVIVLEFGKLVTAQMCIRIIAKNNLRLLALVQFFIFLEILKREHQIYRDLSLGFGKVFGFLLEILALS